MDTTDESSTSPEPMSPEPIYEQMVNEADEATRSALGAESAESDGGQPDVAASG